MERADGKAARTTAFMPARGSGWQMERAPTPYQTRRAVRVVSPGRYIRCGNSQVPQTAKSSQSTIPLRLPDRLHGSRRCPEFVESGQGT